MKSFIARAYLLVLALCQAGNSAQSDADIGTSVHDLLGKHCLDEIPYQAAHALGPEALPYLFKLLGGPSQKAVLDEFHPHYRLYLRTRWMSRLLTEKQNQLGSLREGYCYATYHFEPDQDGLCLR